MMKLSVRTAEKKIEIVNTIIPFSKNKKKAVNTPLRCYKKQFFFQDSVLNITLKAL